MAKIRQYSINVVVLTIGSSFKRRIATKIDLDIQLEERKETPMGMFVGAMQKRGWQNPLWFGIIAALLVLMTLGMSFFVIIAEAIMLCVAFFVIIAEACSSLFRGTAIWFLLFFYPLVYLFCEVTTLGKEVFSRRNLDDAMAIALSGSMSIYFFLFRKDRNG